MNLGVASLSSLLASLLMSSAALAQFPGEEPSPQPPAPPTQPSADPGNLDLGAIDRNAPPAAGEPVATPRAALPGVVTPQAAVDGPASAPGYGYIHQMGSFQILGTTAVGMFMLSANLPFPDGRRSVDFYNARLDYVGRYVDLASGISGHIYKTRLGGPVNDTRYFLFGDQNLNIADNDSNGIRWIVYYNSRGVRTYATTARYYKP